MANEDIKDETVSSASEEEVKESEEQPIVEQEEVQEDSENIDYQAELEREKKRREQAEFTIQKIKERNKGDVPTGIDPGKLEEILAQRDEKILKEVQASEAQRIARENTRSDAEAELAIEYYRTRITPTGNLHEDMQNAILLANRKKYLSEIAEARKSITSSSLRGNGRGAGIKQTAKPKVELTAEERKLMQVYNLSEDEMRKAKQT